ncbi:MAG: xanthine phosphoribosyltransferase [Lachnospiraceae bacterium]|nr:xanthine phosphoribosyltransferase [Lachnospiraceae bacterium]
MEILEQRIKKDGLVKAGNVLKVDSFINHQIDIDLMNEIAKEFKRIFSDVKITKILTIEASGIAIAAIAAQYFKVPVVFAKKSQSINLDGSVYSTKIESFTHKRVYDVIVSKKYISPEDKILVLDDFLANGCAVDGLIDLINESGATLQGVGIIIEKGFQDGGKRLRDKGVRVESLAIIDAMDDTTGEITFRHVRHV